MALSRKKTTVHQELDQAGINPNSYNKNIKPR